MGEHYTTEKNILKLIGPLFLDELRQRFDDSQNESAKLRALLKHLSELRFLDSAAGCGNFLVIAYRELRQLNLDILLRLQELQSLGQGGKRADTSFDRTMFFDETDLAVRMEHFFGIELEEWPARIAATALHLTDHQANQAMEQALGRGPATLPLTRNDSIHVGNALRTDWETITGPTKHLYIMGNPPFIGQYGKTPEQTEDMKLVWGKNYDGYLDYVTAWFAKAVQLFDKPEMGGEFAFVSTNSITQGQPVPALFRYIFSHGWRLKFAHRTFSWSSEAPGAASVHCVITGYYKSNRRTSEETLYYYDNSKSEPRPEPVKQQINAYLIDGANVLVDKRMSHLSASTQTLQRGSQPTDGSRELRRVGKAGLIVEADDYDAVAADPIAAKYLRRYVMGEELINNLDRWCLWLVDFDPTDLNKSAILRDRLEAVRDFRLSSQKAATKRDAATPHLFQENHQPTVQYLGIPRVFSERRRWATCALLSPDIIAGDKVYVCEDTDGLGFALISSSAFMAWQKAVGGRLKSDPSFSNTIVWNNLPIPELTDEQRAAIIAGGQAVLDARAELTKRAIAAGRKPPSLADLYNPLAMAPELLKAHAQLDRAVDAVFGLKVVSTGSTTEADEQRLAALFSSYERLTAAEQLPLPKPKRPRRA